MARAKIKLNRKAVGELLRGPEVRRDLERRARAIKQAAGPDYEVNSEVGPNRARSEVRTATAAARKREAESQSLLRALDDGRR